MIRDNLLASYQWLQSNTPQNVIMGDDLDGGLATLLYLSKNPAAKLVGIYTGYTKLYYNAALSIDDLKNAIYLDLDICQPQCRSLGHHIIRINPDNKLSGFASSCNLNELEHRFITNKYTGKYPLGTIHFLMWLYQVPMPSHRLTEQLIWLADSSFINGQSHRFRINVGDWVHNLMPWAPLQHSFQHLDTLVFEQEMQHLQNRMRASGLNKGNGQVKSRQLQLTGFQCQPNGNESAAQMSQYMLRLLRVLSKVTGWQLDEEQLDISNLHLITGSRNNGSIAAVGNSLDDFLLHNRVFSYVFPFKDSINYTVGIF